MQNSKCKIRSESFLALFLFFNGVFSAGFQNFSYLCNVITDKEKAKCPPRIFRGGGILGFIILSISELQGLLKAN